MKRLLVIIILLLAGLSTKSHAQDFTPALDSNLWVTDGIVNAIAKSGNNIYIGGQFFRVKPMTGKGAILDIDTGKLLAPPLKVNGIVRASVSDGLGGWYIGGDFTFVLGKRRMRLAHILPDNSLDLNWKPTADSSVLCLTMVGSTVYAGGRFTTVSGQSRNTIAAIDAITGQLTSWNAQVVGSVVKTIIYNSDKILFGGSFSTFGGQPRNSLASINISSQQVTSWNPNVKGIVNALALKGDTVFIGGEFDSIGIKDREGVGAVRLSIDSVLAWKFKLVGKVNALAMYRDTIFVGGDFRFLPTWDWQGELYNFAIIDLDSGIARKNIFLQNSGVIYCLKLYESKLFIGEHYGGFFFNEPNGIRSFDLVTNRNTNWNPTPEVNWSLGLFYTISIHNGRVFIGGDFNSVGGEFREGLAAFDATTRKPTPWTPLKNGQIDNILAHNNIIYLTGKFNFIAGQTRYNFAAIDVTTGLATSLQLRHNGQINSMQAKGNTLFLGGTFTEINGQPRNCLAAIDVTTGALLPWNPNAENYTVGWLGVRVFNGNVKQLTLGGNAVYVTGVFSSISGQPRNNFAAIDDNSGQLLPLNPLVNGQILSLASNNDILFLGGEFDFVDLQPRKNIAAINLSSGQLTSFSPIIDGSVKFIKIRDNTVYVRGSFTTISGQPRIELASIDATTGLPTYWKPGFFKFEGTMTALYIDNDFVYVSGQFVLASNFQPFCFAGFSTEGSYAYQPRVSNTTFTYPNPTMGRFRVNNFGDGEATTIRLLNNTGKEVWRGAPSSDGEIDISGLMPGLYHVEALTNSGRRWATRVVKE